MDVAGGGPSGEWGSWRWRWSEAVGDSRENVVTVIHIYTYFILTSVFSCSVVQYII